MAEVPLRDFRSSTLRDFRGYESDDPNEFTLGRRFPPAV